MLKPLMQNTEYSRILNNMTSEKINEYNIEKDKINKNFIKFCIEYGIGSEKPLGCRKAFKYRLISSIKIILI